MRVLITGGSGFIGRNLAERLASKYEVAAPSSAELDLLDEQKVREYLGAHHFDVIVHAATTRSNRRLAAPADMLDRNCRMFFNLVRNQELFGKMIHFGSGAEYGPRALLPSRVKEDYLDIHVPTDAYGFSKYICAKYVEVRGQRLEVRGDIVELRLFAVFGPYEDYTVRFISNACCRVLKGLPIVLRQDAMFDYLYVKDLAEITRWFIENEARHSAYNACSGKPVALAELARMVAKVSGRNPEVRVATGGMGAEYSGDNGRLVEEMGENRCGDLRGPIAELYAWYEARIGALDAKELGFDSK